MVQAPALSPGPSLPSPAATLSAAHAVWNVARRELMEQITSLRFLVISLLVIGLTPLAVFVGARDNVNRRAEYDRLAGERQSLAAGPAGQHVTGMDMPFTPQNDLAVLRALRPPETLSVLVRGLDGALPEYWDFSATGIEAGPSAARSERLVDLLGQLDSEFLVRVVLGLLAILLAFDAVAGEKELGTLRAALSQPVSRPAFLAGKLIGGAVTLWVAVLATFLIGLLSAQLFGISLLDADALAKAALIAATSGTYLLCMYTLGLLISSLTASQKTSLLVSLVVWAVAALALPPLAALVAQAVVPITPAHAVAIKKRVLDDALYRDAARSMGLAFMEIAGSGGGGVQPDGYERHKDEIDRRITPILLGYLSKRRLVGELDRDVERRAARQNDVARTLMALSPSALFVRAAADLAATGDNHYGAWLEAVRRQQRHLEGALFEDPPLVMFEINEMAMAAGRRAPPAGEVEVSVERRGDGPPVGQMNLLVERHRPPPVTSLPAFVPPRRDAAAALVRALPALGLLILYTGAFITAAFIAFARYDVR